MSILENFRRVNRQNPCPICGRTDWCLIGASGTICPRTPSDRLFGSAGFWHPLGSSKPAEYHSKPSPKAPPEVLDEVYRYQLKQLSLSSAHRSHLIARGMSEEEIKLDGYKTFPSSEYYEIAAKLVDKFGISTMNQIPGFAIKKGRYGSYPTIISPPGIAIPIRNVQGQIIGIQIRTDQNGKYRWMSSGNHGGVSSGSPAHYAPGEKVKEVWITEGAIKANMSSRRLRRPFISVAGAGAWRSSGLFEYLRDIGKVKRVVIAYDMDRKDNPFVAHFSGELLSDLSKEGYKAKTAFWLRELKGIDDFLVYAERNYLMTEDLPRGMYVV